MLKYSPSLRKKKKKNISTSNGMHKYYVIAESNVFWSKTFVTNDVLIILWWIGTRQISRWGFFLVWFVSSFLCASLLIRILLCIFHVLQNFFFLFFSIFAFYAVFLSFLHSFYLSIYSFFFFLNIFSHHLDVHFVQPLKFYYRIWLIDCANCTSEFIASSCNTRKKMVSGNFQVASNKILARHNTTEERRLGTTVKCFWVVFKHASHWQTQTRAHCKHYSTENGRKSRERWRKKKRSKEKKKEISA